MARDVDARMIRAESTRPFGALLRDLYLRNPTSFRLVCPDETDRCHAPERDGPPAPRAERPRDEVRGCGHERRERQHKPMATVFHSVKNQHGCDGKKAKGGQCVHTITWPSQRNGPIHSQHFPT